MGHVLVGRHRASDGRPEARVAEPRHEHADTQQHEEPEEDQPPRRVARRRQRSRLVLEAVAARGERGGDVGAAPKRLAERAERRDPHRTHVRVRRERDGVLGCLTEAGQEGVVRQLRFAPHHPIRHDLPAAQRADASALPHRHEARERPRGIGVRGVLGQEDRLDRDEGLHGPAGGGHPRQRDDVPAHLGRQIGGQERTADGGRRAPAPEEARDELAARFLGHRPLADQAHQMRHRPLRRRAAQPPAPVAGQELRAIRVEEPGRPVRALRLHHQREDPLGHVQRLDVLQRRRILVDQRVVHVERRALERDGQPVEAAALGQHGEVVGVEVCAEIRRARLGAQRLHDVLLEERGQPLVRVDEQIGAVAGRDRRLELRRVRAVGLGHQLDTDVRMGALERLRDLAQRGFFLPALIIGVPDHHRRLRLRADGNAQARQQERGEGNESARATSHGTRRRRAEPRRAASRDRSPLERFLPRRVRAHVSSARAPSARRRGEAPRAPHRDATRRRSRRSGRDRLPAARRKASRRPRRARRPRTPSPPRRRPGT